MNRRDVVFSTGALLLGSPLLGCVTVRANPAPSVPRETGLIDVHTHLFNGSDLPTVRFIKIVVLKHYPKQSIRTLDIDDPDTIDGLLALFTWIVGRTKAPTAAEETEVLRGKQALTRNLQTSENEAAVVSAVASFSSVGVMGVSEGGSTEGVRKIRRAILKAAGEDTLAASDKNLTDQEANVVAQKAYRSKFDLGLMLRWFALFTRYRYSLADQLAADHARQGFKPLLLCPAMIDYDSWLGEHVDKSPLPKQVKVMGELSRRRVGPAVHGYVGFDPLRQVLFDERRFTEYNPLDLVKTAIRDEGFLGVKLYPPMGFRATGNASDVCQTYPDDAVFKALLSGQPDDPRTRGCNPRPANGSLRVSEKLDGAMNRLFSLCIAEDACIIAHANDSNGAAKDFSHRADPSFWISAFESFPALRVCLAHFGHFTARSARAPDNTVLPESSWEWTLGRYLSSKPNAPVFADISYLTEIFEQSSNELTNYTKTMRRWIFEFDRECRHLMFGTDWTMLGANGAYERFSGGVYEYFRESVGLSTDQLNRLFVGNAATFLGLRERDPARKRLMGFYKKNSLPANRLPSFGA
jgi:predicted TIM-barrel fold metal-dependent hydrolase